MRSRIQSGIDVTSRSAGTRFGIPARRSRLRQGVRITAYLFMLPAVTIYGLFFLVPLVRMVILSLQDWNGLTLERQWVGLGNYAALLQDAEFWQALSHNLMWVLLASLPILLGLALAVVLHHRQPRGGKAYRVIYFLPYTLTIVLVRILWQWIYHPLWGPINAFLKGIGLGTLARGWLGQPDTALPALAMAANWTGYGFCMMLFLAGLAHIEPVLYEAARIDGATSWQQFRHVTFPGLTNTLNVVILVVFIATVRVFDMVYVTTRGGPMDSTEVLGTLIHRQTFENLNIGYGAALSVMTALIILFASLGYLRLRERGE